MFGETIGDYRVLAKLGEGGMGEVFLAEHTRIFRTVALKILRSELSAHRPAVERLFAEARATALLRHPNIVDVFDCDVHVDGRAYIAMESLEGEDLGHLLQAGASFRDEPAVAVAIAAKMASALGAAHERGMIHRDVKPENTFLVYAGSAGPVPGVKILDFGVARFVTDRSRRRTGAGAFVGTPTYMSPEQCRGNAGLQPTSDVYALGCVLYQMVTGRPPFLHDSPGELIAAHLHEPPARAAALNPALPGELDELLAATLAKRPEDRPATMDLLGRAFERHLGVPARELDGLLAGSGVIRATQDRWRAGQRSGASAPSDAGLRAGPETIDLGSGGLVGPTSQPPGDARAAAAVVTPDPDRRRRRRDAIMVGVGAMTVAAAFGYLRFLRGASPAPVPAPHPAGPAADPSSLASPAAPDPAHAAPAPLPSEAATQPAHPPAAPARPAPRPRRRSAAAPDSATPGFWPVPD